MPNQLDAQNEEDRLRALKRLGVVDTPPEPEFDALVEAAALICETPISLISLIDHDRQWFKANYGLSDTSETSRSVSFCAHTIAGDSIFEVTDAASDPRFSANSLVTSDPNIRFYAGAPLRLEDGARIGAICVIDSKPRKLTQSQRKILLKLSQAAVQLLQYRQLTHDLTASNNRFRALSDSCPLGIFSTDAKGGCTYTNSAWQSIFNLTQEQAQGHGWRQTLHPDDQSSVFSEWIRATALKQDFDMKFRIRHHNGVVRFVRAVARAVTNRDGDTTSYVGSVQDITVQTRLSNELEYRATHDSLTGLINRSEFEVQLQKALNEAKEHDAQHALMFIDLDQFKRVNDACGHSAGDQLLRQVTNEIGQSIRAQDVFARIGGDEFAIILNTCSAEQAKRSAQMICDRIGSFEFMHDERSFRIGTSIGLVDIHNRWTNLEMLIRAADTACYTAKGSGRNRVHHWIDSNQLQTAPK